MDTLPSMKEIVSTYELGAKKGLGQHFLFDLNITDKILRFAGDLSGKHVLEIGPGPGALTRSILQTNVAMLYAIEKDERCVHALQDYLHPKSNNRLHIIEGNALDEALYDMINTPVTIIANLPYNVGTPLLVFWLSHLQWIDQMVLMFQKEVVDRIVALPGSKAYGRLSILASALCDVDRCFNLPPQAFNPPPKVESAVVRLVPKAHNDVNIKALEQVTHMAFSKRRKTMRSIFKQSPIDMEAFLQDHGLDANARPETLSVEHYKELASML